MDNQEVSDQVKAAVIEACGRVLALRLKDYPSRDYKEFYANEFGLLYKAVIQEITE